MTAIRGHNEALENLVAAQWIIFTGGTGFIQLHLSDPSSTVLFWSCNPQDRMLSVCCTVLLNIPALIGDFHCYTSVEFHQTSAQDFPRALLGRVVVWIGSSSWGPAMLNLQKECHLSQTYKGPQEQCPDRVLFALRNIWDVTMVSYSKRPSLKPHALARTVTFSWSLTSMAASVRTASVNKLFCGVPKCPNTFLRASCLDSHLSPQLERGICGF